MRMILAGYRRAWVEGQKRYEDEMRRLDRVETGRVEVGFVDLWVAHKTDCSILEWIIWPEHCVARLA